MADNSFRSYRSRDGFARERIDQITDDGANDPLAELARLIGQGDPNADRYDRADPPAAGGAADQGWAPEERYTEQYPEDRTYAEGPAYRDDRRYVDDRRYADEEGVAAGERYAQPYVPAPAEDSYSQYAEQDYGRREDSPTSERFFSGPAAAFSGFRDGTAEEDRHRHEGPPPLPRNDSAPPFVPAGHEDSYEANEDSYEHGFEEHADAHADAAGDYYDPPEKGTGRRTGLIVGMAVVGLAVLGSAGAFGYHAMFGGSLLPSLPPIIKASTGPNKIVPTYGDARTESAIETGTTTKNQPEKLASHEEQPVNIPDPPKAAPRIVSTIPITPGQGTGFSPAGEPGIPAAVPPLAAAPAPATDASAEAATSALPAGVTAPIPPPAAAPVSTEPKKVHTVSIHSDQARIAAQQAAARNALRAAAAAKLAASGGGNGPLSLVPGAAPEAPAPARMRVAAAPPPAATTGSERAAAPMRSSRGGGYAVQLTSQRSEADAEAAFRALQTKYPDQLGGRQPIVRRADLGAKGTYYRALVGPYASAEEAAGVCSSLKAAGGSCLVQRN